MNFKLKQRLLASGIVQQVLIGSDSGSLETVRTFRSLMEVQQRPSTRQLMMIPSMYLLFHEVMLLSLAHELAQGQTSQDILTSDHSL